MRSEHALTAFGSDGALVPASGIVFGGTWILNEFLRDVANSARGRLAIAVPYVDRGVAELSGAVSQMNHREIDLVLLTGWSDAPKAWAELRGYPWRSVLISRNRNLHAKLYSFVSPNGHGSCLIGSHNLTVRGLQKNLEAGVLMRSDPLHPEMQGVIIACQQQVLDLTVRSTVFVDTNKWPSSVPTEVGGGLHHV